jgi:poly(ADP-ribose) glycohydrolase ARH3
MNFDRNTISVESRFVGVLIGLAAGDALCAPYEGGILERLLWCVIGKTKDKKYRYTDDTQMSLDLAEYLIEDNDINQDKLAMRFARNYRWSRGYGPAVEKLLKGIRAGKHWSDLNRATFKDGSFGNGAAMRSPVIGLYCLRVKEKISHYCKLATEITHAHPVAIDGSILIADIVNSILNGVSPRQSAVDAIGLLHVKDFRTRMNRVIELFDESCSLTPLEVRKQLGNGVSALNSCPTAVYIGVAFAHRSFSELIDFVVNVGGDADTIAAMAGSVWGATNGESSFDKAMVNSIEDAGVIQKTASNLYKISCHKA